MADDAVLQELRERLREQEERHEAILSELKSLREQQERPPLPVNRLRRGLAATDASRRADDEEEGE